jgi:threonine dehydrogenase-like Zn-dependent dehydrogenase
MTLALTVEPKKSGTVAIEEISDPVAEKNDLLVDGLLVGICGTDVEIFRGDYGWAPPGRNRLVIGHESLGRVAQAPSGSGFAQGDLVVGVVRRPDPEPCGACARGEWDMCRNGRYRERGIKELDGYAAQQWTVPAEYAVHVDAKLEHRGVLLEPTSVVAKAWEQIERIGSRAWFEPKSLLVTGAGPIGLLAALIGAQRGLDVHVVDRVTDGPKPTVVRDLGAIYHHADVAEVAKRVNPDVVVEATGVDSVVLDTLAATASYGIVCLTGVSSGGHSLKFDASAANREIVLENDCIVGSVNANLRHYRAAAAALASADQQWLERLITRRVPLRDFQKAFERDGNDVKVVLEIQDAQ